MRDCTVAATEMATGWGLKTFTRDALDELHAATLDVLRTTGVSVDCDEALKILEKGERTSLGRLGGRLLLSPVFQCLVVSLNRKRSGTIVMVTGRGILLILVSVQFN